MISCKVLRYFNNAKLFIPTAVVLTSFILLSACATHIAPLDAGIVREKIGFLKIGETNRQEVFDRLGVPVNIYENGLIVTYTMNEKDFNPDVKYSMNVYTLVLVFRPDHVLEKFSMVRLQ